MAVLNVRGFPDELKRDAKSEADLDGQHLRVLVIEAVQREVERRRSERSKEQRTK